MCSERFGIIYFIFIKHSIHFAGYHDTIIPANFCDADEYDDYCDGVGDVVDDDDLYLHY